MCAHTHMNENYSLKGLKFISEKTKLALRSSWTCHASAFQFLLTCCPSQTLRNASVWEALEGACGLRLRVVCTLPPVLRIWAQYPPLPFGSTGQLDGEDTGAAAAGEFP